MDTYTFYYQTTGSLGINHVTEMIKAESIIDAISKGVDFYMKDDDEKHGDGIMITDGNDVAFYLYDYITRDCGVGMNIINNGEAELRDIRNWKFSF